MILFYPSRSSLESLSPVGRAEFSQSYREIVIKTQWILQCKISLLSVTLKGWLSQPASLVLEIFSFPRRVELAGQAIS